MANQLNKYQRSFNSTGRWSANEDSKAGWQEPTTSNTVLAAFLHRSQSTNTRWISAGERRGPRWPKLDNFLSVGLTRAALLNLTSERACQQRRHRRPRLGKVRKRSNEHKYNVDRCKSKIRTVLHDWNRQNFVDASLACAEWSHAGDRYALRSAASTSLRWSTACTVRSVTALHSSTVAPTTC